MPELGRSLSLSEFGRSAWVVGIFFVLLIGSLFFIPELIQFQRSVTGGATDKVVQHEETQEEKPGLISEGKDFLARHLPSFRGKNRKDEATEPVEVAQQMPEEIPAPADLNQFEAMLDSSDKSGPRASLKSNVSQSAKGKAWSDGPGITWEQIRSGPSKEALGSARRRSLELARSLPTRAESTRYALINFANGLEFAVNRGSESMSAKDAVDYLTNLDRAVTAAMFQEVVDREIYKRWVEISMGPAFEKSKLSREHNRYQMQFNPRITLTSVQVQHQGRVVKGKDKTRIYAGFSGFVVGDDIRRAELVSEDGVMHRKLILTPDPRGYKFFRVGTIDAKRRWIIRVYDKYDELYEKNYDFASVAGRMPIEDRYYQLPFRMVYASRQTFRPRDVDPRLDAYFRYAARQQGGGEQSEAGALFVSF